MDYTWVLFDADGTLFDYDRAERTALARVFQLNGLEFKPAWVPAYRQINQKLWLDFENGLVTADVLKVRRFETLLLTLGIDHPAEDFSDPYLRSLAGCSELVEGAIEVLRTLRTRCRFAIVTNGLQLVQRPRVEHSAIRDLISEIVISEEIGHAKPARGFFDVVFARLGYPTREEVLLVGDSWSSDIQGAVNYGIAACWFNPTGKPRPASPPIQYEISSLGELLPICGC
jgi:2-haloacid dehalogenase